MMNLSNDVIDDLLEAWGSLERLHDHLTRALKPGRFEEELADGVRLAAKRYSICVKRLNAGSLEKAGKAEEDRG